MIQKVVLITGLIGSGKTAVAKRLNEYYRIPVFYSDIEAKKLYENPEILAHVDELMGGGIISNGILDKDALAKIIFNDKEKMQILESYIHPLVREKFIAWKSTKISPVVIMESAIALKNGRDDFFDYVVFVDAPESVRLERAMKRDNAPREKILERMNSQIIDSSSANFIIDNTVDFKDSVEKFYDELLNLLKIAVFTGSFDPFTNGHLSLLIRASALFNQVFVAFSQNAKKQRQFEIEAMKTAIEKTIKIEGLKNCHVVVNTEMTGDLCKKLSAKYLIRGLRNCNDYLYEDAMADVNEEVNSHVETLFYRGKSKISSSTVREYLSYGKSIENYVPSPVFDLICPKSVGDETCQK